MKYLEPFVDALVTNILNDEVPEKLDIVLEGSGMNGGYEIGSLCYLKALEKSKKTKIMRISGVSCGALIGAVFLTLDLDVLEEFYIKMINTILSFGNFCTLEKYINEFVNKLDDEKLKLLNKRLYISYVDLNTLKRVVVSNYKSKEYLKDILIKTAFIPGLIDGSLTKERCIDGGIPYIFPNDIEKRQTGNYKTLYIRITSLKMLKNAICTKGEFNSARRSIDGIQYTHDLFKQKKSNEFASIVENWTKYEIIQYTFMSIVWWFITYLTFLIHWIYNDIIPLNIKEHKITLRMKGMAQEIWLNYLDRLIKL